MTLIEVCIDSVESAVAAVKGGADRLELCSNLGIGGGTTPSLGLVKAVKKAVPSVPIMVMVRPRTGDFLYSNEELEVMVEDIAIFKQYDVRGFVIGVLTAEGRVDVLRTRKLVDAILPMEACFHRAFDMTRCLEEGKRATRAIMDSYSESSNPAFHDLFDIPGITRILTRWVKKYAQTTVFYPPFSGGMNSAPEALPTLKSLCLKAQQPAGNRSLKNLTILPGSGINSKTVRGVLNVLLPCGLQEIHLSGGRWEDSPMVYRPESVTLGPSDWVIWRTHEESVREVRVIADELACR